MQRLALALALTPLAAAAEPAGSSAPDEGEPVRVYGRAPPDAAGEVRVDPLLVAHKPARTAEALLELVPGLYVVQHGSEGKGHQLYIRGFDALHGADVEVRLDGIPLNEPSNVHGHGYVDLGWLPPEVIDGLSATRGVSDVAQGDFATAGSVELSVGVAPAERGVMASVEGGTTGRLRGFARYAPAGRDGALVAAEAVRDEGFGQNRALRRAGAIGRFEAEVGGGRLSALAAVHHADFGLPSAVRLDDVDAGRIGLTDSYADDTAGRSQRALGGLRYRMRVGALRLDAGAFAQARALRLDEWFTGYLDDPLVGDGHRQTHDAVGGGLDTRLRLRLAERWGLVAHATWGVDGFEQRQIPSGDGIDMASPDRDLRGTQHRAAVAAALRVRPWDWLTLDGGARLSVWHLRADDAALGEGRATPWALAPRLRARAAVGDWLLFAAYGRGLRPPEVRSVVRAAPVGDAEVDRYAGGAPEVTLSDSVEVGARWQPLDALTVTAAGFAVGIEREQIYDHVSATTIERGATRRRGVELDVSAAPWPWLRIGASGSLVDAGFVDGEPIPGVPSALARFDAALHHPDGWRGALSALALGPRPLGDGAEAAPAAVIDAAIGYRWPLVELELTVENVLDTPWREGEYRFASWWDRDRPRSALPAIHAFAGSPRQARLAVTGWF